MADSAEDLPTVGFHRRRSVAFKCLSKGIIGSEKKPTLMPRNENAAFYQLFLQTPEAEAGLGRDLRRTFRSQFYLLSGDKPPSADGGFPAGMVPRKGAVLADPPSLPGWIRHSSVPHSDEFTNSGL